MATTQVKQAATVRVCSLSELEEQASRVVSAEGRTVFVLADQGKVYALDNRRPHIGFPFNQGTVRDGIHTFTGITPSSTWRGTAHSIPSPTT